MRLLLLLTTLLSLEARAFTLNNTIGARFKDAEVDVRVGINPTNCPNGIDLDEIASLLDDAVNEFWNRVPTSRLRLKNGGTFNTGNDDYFNGELCLLGGSGACAPAVPTAEGIVITCNTNTINNFPDPSLLALTLPNLIRGKDIKSAVVLINASSPNFNNLSRNKKVAVIAHELGHAIGLGHSEERAALMYYAVVPTRNRLGQDDIDGVTYLYPVQLDLYGMGCFLNSVDLQGGDSQGPGPMLLTLLIGFLAALSLGRRSRGA